MSIWCNWEHVGYEDDDCQPRRRKVRWGKRGEVRSYAGGWSNHYPTTDGKVEQRAGLNINHIPVWCVPGHEGDFSEDTVGEWTRIDMWTREHEGKTVTTRFTFASVVLDEEAARALVEDLTKWLDIPKTRAER